MPHIAHYTDDDLLALLATGEAVAFKQIYKKYWYKLYVYANKRLRCKEAAEEVVQNFFIGFWMKREQLKINSSLEAYLYTAVRYCIIDHVVKEATRNNYYQLAYLDHKVADNCTEDVVILNDLVTAVEKEVVKLPVKCRSVFMLSRNEHKSNKEIAAELGISEKTVENHITNAIKHLRLNLKHSLCLAGLLMLLR